MPGLLTIDGVCNIYECPIIYFMKVQHPKLFFCPSLGQECIGWISLCPLLPLLNAPLRLVLVGGTSKSKRYEKGR